MTLPKCYWQSLPKLSTCLFMFRVYKLCLLQDADCPHDVGVTGARTPARHHDHHVAGLEEPSCFSC